jgi:DNA-directed RNA polymerase subunit RPC12/RpoP
MTRRTRRDSTVRTYVCEGCGAEFGSKPSRNAKYCSHPCFIKHGQTRPAEERFFDKIKFADRWYDNGIVRTRCLEWAGSLTKGYGEFTITRKKSKAHRWLYERWVGPIPEDLELDHLCRNRACVNPSHLESVTRTMNILRGESPPARNARSTHCVQGHEFTPENTRINRRDGGRECRACGREKARNNRARKALEKRAR